MAVTVSGVVGCVKIGTLATRVLTQNTPSPLPCQAGYPSKPLKERHFSVLSGAVNGAIVAPVSSSRSASVPGPLAGLRLSVAGPGRVGSSLARWALAAGAELVAVAGR